MIADLLDLPDPAEGTEVAEELSVAAVKQFGSPQNKGFIHVGSFIVKIVFLFADDHGFPFVTGFSGQRVDRNK